jgi:hypothetical protein
MVPAGCSQGTSGRVAKKPLAPLATQAGAHLIEKVAHGVAPRKSEWVVEQGPWSAGRDVGPKRAQPIDPVIRRIAGDDGGVDRPDGYAGDPIGLNARLGKRFIDARLIRAERTATLQD